MLPNPAKALELVINLAEYVTPKLARTELTGDRWTDGITWDELQLEN